MRIPGKFIGLDFETTSSSLDKARAIQIGLAIPKDGQVLSFGALCKPEGEWGVDYEVDAEASKIHGISREQVEAARPTADVDIAAYGYLQEHAKTPNHLIAVGWNVAAFDLNFLRKEFLFTRKRIGYRTVDLNALLFTLSTVNGWKFDKLKNGAKSYAAEMLTKSGYSGSWHNAEYDAVGALYSWEWIMSVLKSDEFYFSVLQQRIFNEECVPADSTTDSRAVVL